MSNQEHPGLTPSHPGLTPEQDRLIRDCWHPDAQQIFRDFAARLHRLETASKPVPVEPVTDGCEGWKALAVLRRERLEDREEELANLRAEVERLTRERDEARESEKKSNAAVDAVPDATDEPLWAQLPRWIRERDEARAQLAELTDKPGERDNLRCVIADLMKQCQDAREQGRQEVREGIASFMESQAEHYSRNAADPAMLRKEFNEWAHDFCRVLARNARNWKPEGGAT